MKKNTTEGRIRMHRASRRPILQMILGRLLCLLLMALALSQPILAQFNHPGALSTQSDLNRMAAKVSTGAQPWTGSWNILVKNTDGFLNDTPLAVTTVYVDSTAGSDNYIRMAQDCAKAYQCALRYHGSGDTRFADTAVQILNAWAATHTSWSGNSNVSLRAGLYGYQFACAAELLRNYGGWNAADFTAFKNYLLNQFYPINAGFLRRHHDTCDSHYWANWEHANMTALLSIGVLCDDQSIFDEALLYFFDGVGNGKIGDSVWYVHPNGLGQWQESGRDQGHSLMGPQLLGTFLEIAWNQGYELYGYDNNRFLAGVEYISKYNTWHDVNYRHYTQCDGWASTQVSATSRGSLRPGWDLVYNHYVNRKGVVAPHTAHYAREVGPEGGGFNYGTTSGGFDGLGFTTLTHSLDPIAAGAVPGSLRPTQQEWQITLSWAGSAYATSYNVKRATTSGGPYTTLATVGAKNLHYVDAGLTAGTTYYYVVSANNPGGESAHSAPASIRAVAAGGATIQTENATWGGGAQLITWTTGHNGSGSVVPMTGGYIEFTGINGGTGGIIPLEIRYALGNANRTGVFTVNGVAQDLTAASTGDWDKWDAHIVNVTLNSGTNNTVRITADGTDNFAYIDQLTVKNSTAAPAESRPASPGGLIASPVGMSEMYLSWNPVAGARSYNLKRATTPSGPYVVLDNMTGTSSPDTGLLADTTYYYAVSAINAAGQSLDSVAVAGTTPHTETIQAEDASYGGGCTFETAYAGYNGTGCINYPTSGGYIELRNLNGGSGGTATLDIRYALGSTARTGVLIVNGVSQNLTFAGTGAWTTWATHTVNIPLKSEGNTIRLESSGQDYANVDEFTLTVITAPIGLSVAAVSSSQISLNWTASTGATSYTVKRATTSGGPYTTLASDVTSTTYTDTGLSAATTYYYVVSAVSSVGESANSAEASATTQAAPAFVAAGTVSAGTGSIQSALPSGIFTGDVLLLFVESAAESVAISNHNGGTWSTVTGATQSTGSAGGGSSTRLVVFWSRYNGSQGAPSVSDSGNHQLARMIAIRGAVASGTPWDAVSGGVEATADTSGSIPGATTTVPGTLVVVAVSANLPDANGTSQFSGWTNASLTNLTERTDNTTNAGNGGGLGVATGVKSSVGTYGATAVTHANSAQKAFVSVAIK